MEMSSESFNANNVSHWNERGKHGNFNHGEYFYTISPIPFYKKRRKVLINLIQPYLNISKTVCDLGCGDGWYVHHFLHNIPTIHKIVGVDISAEMINNAKTLNTTTEFYQSENGIKDGISFDLVYSIAVLAHVDDDALPKLIDTVVTNLHTQGKYIVFEQVAPFIYSGTNFIRRRIIDYKNLFREKGLTVEKIVLIDYRCHRFFERFIAKGYYRFMSKGHTDHERRLYANSQWLFRALSSFFLLFDLKPQRHNVDNGWGNVFIVVSKH
jgi:SAM-dependent methyltransferase